MEKPTVIASKFIRLFMCFIAIGIFQPLAAFAETTWDVTQPRGETREISFETDEGTWMSVDLSPDGRSIVFDLLGHIYRMPASGGDAEPLTQSSGIAINIHPRYSPDGSEIAFISDRGGQENLWVMQSDGSKPRVIVEDMDARFAEPAWSPDGAYIVVTKRSKTASGFYRTADALWRYPRTGGTGEALVQLSESGEAAPARSGLWSGTARAQWPAYSPDGEYLYFQTASFSGGDRYIRRLHAASGKLENVTESKGGYSSCCGRPAYPSHLLEVAPQVSPDGRYLTFARKLPGGRTSYRGHELNGRTTLWMRDLVTGDERIIMDPISNTLGELHPSWHTRVLPGYAWAKDSRSIIISQGGKIRRLTVASGKVDTIPFKAKVHRTISQQARGQVKVDGTSFAARAIRWPAVSPDGSKLVFEAVGKLWIQSLPTGQPTPLTADMPDAFQLTPSWSPDGKWIAFASSSDTQGGHVWKVPAPGGKPIRLTTAPGRFLYPAWGDNQVNVIVSSWPMALNYGGVESPQWQLVRLPAAGGAAETLTPPSLPAAIAHGQGGEYWAQIGDKLVHAANYSAPPAEIATVAGSASWPGARALPSPDGRWLAVTQFNDVHLLPMPPASGAELPAIDAQTAATRLSQEGGYYPVWRDATHLDFAGAKKTFSYAVASKKLTVTDINLTLDRDLPTGSVALTDARIITLDKRQVIAQGSVVVAADRITCVGDCDLTTVDKRVSLQGKTIVPGFVDTHAHHLGDDDASLPQHRNKSAAYLAYGVTTVYEPGGGGSVEAFTVAEMIDAGRMVGPRTFSTGSSLTCGPFSGVRELNSFEETQHQVNRIVDLGAISLKDYKQCSRLQRTWLAEASRQRGVSLTSEGSDYNYFLGLMMTGHAGFEHPIHVRPTYSDAARFFGQAGAHYSSQIAMAGDYPESVPIEYWLSQNDVWLDPRIQEWNPWQEIATRRTYVKKPLNDYGMAIQAETAADIKRNGGYPTTGGHGEMNGLDTHWEVWAYTFGMSPMDALEAASYGGAHFIGLEHEIGSITVGKLADLLVLKDNPLDDIRNTTGIEYVMKGGHLFEAITLDEIWPSNKPYGAKPWNNSEATRSDLRPDDYWDK